MVFVKYKYGFHAKEIKELLRKRILCKSKVRYHDKKIKELEHKIKQIELEVARIEAQNKK